MTDIFDRITNYINSFHDTKVRSHVDFNNAWSFSDVNDSESYRYDYNDGNWQTVDLPHDYSAGQGFDINAPSGINGAYVKTGIVWYRKKFDASGMEGNKLVRIHFDGVAANSRVYINGHFLGQYPGPYSPFWYDLAPHLYFDKPNVIAVMCDTSLQPFSRFYIGTGIYRKVCLTVTDSLHFEPFGVFARTEKIDTDGALIKIDASVSANAFTGDMRPVIRGVMTEDVIGKCRLVSHIIDAEGNTAASVSVEFKLMDFTRKTISQSVTVKNPKLWNAFVSGGGDLPHLYKIHSYLYKDDTMFDDVIVPLGIRTLDYDSEEGFRINGNCIKLKGACMHQDMHVYGNASNAKSWAERIAILQEMGCNSIRASHHPFPDDFYHVCDFMGMTVMDEAFDEWRHGWGRYLSKHGKNRYGYYLYFDQWWEADLSAMILRGRNHPGIIMWSFGNEIPELYFEESVPILTKMQKLAKELDTGRPTTVCLEGSHNHPFNPLAMGIPDIAGFNYVCSKYGIRDYDTLHREHPEYVICNSENMLLPAVWKAVRDRKFVSGQYIWTGFDYLGESVDISGIDKNTATLTEEFMGGIHDSYGGGKPLLHGFPNTLIEITNVKKPGYYVRKAMWTEEPMVKLAVKTGEWTHVLSSKSHWNWKAGATLPVLCITNCEKTVLKLNGRIVHSGITDKNDPEPKIVNVTFEPGILELTGFSGDRESCRDCLVTAGAPAQIKLHCECDTVRPGDFIHVAAEITDADGITVPFTNQLLSVNIADNSSIKTGELFGMATGDLYDGTPFTSNAFVPFNGYCLAVIKALRSGEIKASFEFAGIKKTASFWCR